MSQNEHVPVTTFELIEFNHVRDMRGKEAAKISIVEDGEPQGYLWMSVSDLRANMRKFGRSEGLEKALRAYGKKI